MLTNEELHRYARQILLPEVGGAGQAKVKKARVLCVGAGGLGSPAALYLAAAGVGTLGLIDNDPVELSNLHRQILHATPDVGRPKTESAEAKLSALNPGVRVIAHRARLDPSNASGLIAGYDAVVDGSDNFPTRYLVNDACVMGGKPLVSGAVVRWEGQVTTVLPRRGHCYRCVFPEPPRPGAVQSCSEAGIIGPAAGAVGSLQALEVLKLLLGMPGLSERLLTLDFKTMTFRQIPVKRNPLCAVCGDTPSVTVLRLETEPAGGCAV